ncbi:MAG: hypothetical protein K5846_07835 [Bacteroidales bacterium]|nr:hypothetical protein [Bacteroidales bacterium]
MRKALAFILLIITCGFVQAQVRLSDRQRDEQIRFIRNDTLPVTVNALPFSINSRFSEFSPVLLPDSTFLFTSMRADREEDADRYFETSWYCNIYRSQLLSDGDYAPAVALPSSINNRRTFNSNFCWNAAQNELIYSRCLRDNTNELRCSLWRTCRNNRGWSSPQKLPSAINAESSTNMQPCLVTMHDFEVLYFVSNRKSGFGGLDIWYSIRKNGKFDVPINAGPIINTEGNEITPFYDPGKKILYFSSDEHLGIGDYDIFYAEGALSQWGEVANMGVPYNSPYNDFYFQLLPDGESGYFSSNRPHDDLQLEDTCCNDIFHFQKHYPEETPAESKDTVSMHEKIASVLPITLYFQNDQPDPKTLSDTTKTDYPALYNRYVADMQHHIAQSISGLDDDSMHIVRQMMIRFMRDSVAAGYGRLLAFTRYLKEALTAGDSVGILISGYASPLHNPVYNRHLSARRIVSLVNYLRTAEGGFFRPYLDGSRAGLTLRTDPQGAVGPAFTTDDTRETVYGIQAAKERKIVVSILYDKP